MSRSRVIQNRTLFESNWPQGEPTGLVKLFKGFLEKLGVHVILGPPHGKPGGWLKMIESTFEQEVDGQAVQRTWLSVSRNGQTGLTGTADAVVVAAIHEAADGTRSLVVTDEFRVPLNAPEKIVTHDSIHDFSHDTPPKEAVREHGFVAGLIEKGQTAQQAAAIELLQETGLTVTRFVNLPMPFTISSAGMSNECSQILFCYCKGTPSREHLEPYEDINTTLVPFADILDWLKRPVPWSGRAVGIMMGLMFSGRLSWDTLDMRTGIKVQGNRVMLQGPDGGDIALLQSPVPAPFEVQILDPMRARVIEAKNVSEQIPEIPESDVTFFTGRGTDEPIR
jgi:hypothetical protein